MAAVLVPTGSVTFVRVVEIGTVWVYVSITWDADVILTGVPAIVLTDQNGNDHNPVTAAPHVTDPAEYVPLVRLGYNGVPAFDTYEVDVPGSVAGIVSAVGGNTTAADTYPVVPPA